MACSHQVRQILLGSRKPSTRATYMAKWKRFSTWAEQQGQAPLLTPVPFILDYLLHLEQQGLSLFSVRAHLDAISAFHPGADSFSVFTNPLVSRFLRGLDRLVSLSLPGILIWSSLPSGASHLSPWLRALCCTCHIRLRSSWPLPRPEMFRSSGPSRQSLPTLFFTRTRSNSDHIWRSFLRWSPNSTWARTFFSLCFIPSHILPAGSGYTLWMFEGPWPSISKEPNRSESLFNFLWLRLTG